MSRQAVIGVDIGTQGTKAALFTRDGTCLARAFRKSRLLRPAPGTVEEDPEHQVAAVCRTIRQDPELSKTKILAISGMTNPAEIEAIKAAGANDFIKKPFNIENFIDRMIELVRRR